MEFKRLSNGLSDIDEIARSLLNTFPDERIFLFDAPMGSGKTTFVKALCKVLGYKGETSSPTFSLVQEYSAGPLKIFHFDLYRLESPEQLLDIGFEDYLQSNAYVFIEWPQLATTLLKDYSTIIVSINVQDDKREFSARRQD